ncbi:minichromosome maintenance protein MCM [Candidatus Woesearchaeota archaeon]|nr:minichromosome maintenance protein MCM [Candidatus Woesearchaeota archaeon]
MDKMSNEDRSAMHEALENQTVSISKANIQATLISRTTVLAAANPKLGRFDKYDIIANQIDLPPTLINRFDLIFPILDVPDEARDEKMAKHILSLHQEPDLIEPEISTEILRKYIGYAKQKIRPKLSPAAVSEIHEFYLKMRMSGMTDGNVKAIPISARQLEALVRMSEASARLRLSNEVTKKDARRAIGLLEYCLMQVGFDKETGRLDIDRIATGIGASQRSYILTVKDVLAELEQKFNKLIPIEAIVAGAREKGIDDDKVEEALEKLRRSGDVFEPKRGFISRI